MSEDAESGASPEVARTVADRIVADPALLDAALRASSHGDDVPQGVLDAAAACK